MAISQDHPVFVVDVGGFSLNSGNYVRVGESTRLASGFLFEWINKLDLEFLEIANVTSGYDQIMNHGGGDN